MAAGTPPGIPDPGGPQGRRDGVVTVTTQDNSGDDTRHSKHRRCHGPPPQAKTKEAWRFAGTWVRLPISSQQGAEPREGKQVTSVQRWLALHSKA
ncbi:unnamed protein product [Boreogadus saida]